ncbi:MAG: hypothetical protein JSU05_11660, partial [Bacteroidetes bacterium]|nr:hypothetical protein [Bacteroidota bacterium]
MDQKTKPLSSSVNNSLEDSLIRLQESEFRWKLALEGTNYGVWEMDFE